MSVEPSYADERIRFRDYYRTLTDNDLARLSLDENLVPAARDAITEELEARGLRDLSSFKERFAEEMAAAKAEGVLGGLPTSELAKEEPPQRDQQLLGLVGLVMFGLVGVHGWLLGDAANWRKEGALAVWLFWALMFTWDPTIRAVRGEASRKVIVWLVLGWLYFGSIAAVLAVPALGAVVGGNQWLVLVLFTSPAIVFGAYKVLTRLASRSR
jgi:hypothetical protein